MFACTAALSLLISKAPITGKNAMQDEPTLFSMEPRGIPDHTLTSKDGAQPILSQRMSSASGHADPIPPKPAFVASTAVIQKTFDDAASALGLDAYAISALRHAFAQQVDFRRDIRAGETLTIVRSSNAALQSSDDDRPLAARISDGNQKDSRTVVLFQLGNGTTSYYLPDGQGTQPAFSRYPLTFTRVSSKFSLRRLDPITHHWQSHDGVDLAAPTGRPVHASANGTIAFVGRETGYGRMVIINNVAPYSTRFAHLSRFRKGLRAGTHVKRGQVIGYVGESGWATGPHLHYEVRMHGVAMDPLKVPLPTQTALHGGDLRAFESQADKLTALL